MDIARCESLAGLYHRGTPNQSALFGAHAGLLWRKRAFFRLRLPDIPIETQHSNLKELRPL